MVRSAGKPNMALVDDSREIDPESAAAIVGTGSTLVRQQTQYYTAISVQVKRVRTEIQKAVIEEAQLAGEDFFYSWSTKNKDGTRGLVEGISIEGAMILFRNWCNCAIPTEVYSETPTHWTFCTTFVDLETGASFPRLFRQRKNQTAGGKMDADRMMDIAYQIGQSKCQRNAIDKFMPNWLTGPALEKAKANAEGKYSNLEESNKAALLGFKRWAITQLQLEEKLGLKMEYWTARDHVSLSGLYRALRDRQTTVSEEFPIEQDQAQGAAQAKTVAQEPPKPQANLYGSDETRQSAPQPDPPAQNEPLPNSAAPPVAKESTSAPAASAPAVVDAPSDPAAAAKAEPVTTAASGSISAAEAAEIAAAERAEAQELSAPPKRQTRPQREPGSEG